MKRKAIYVTKQIRICSLPNGYWQAQYTSGGQGTRTYDPWRGLFRPTDSLDLATAQAKAYAKTTGA